MLAQQRQQLAFEPPDFSELYGHVKDQTIGGVLAGNLAGPRRIKAGAARDHFLGLEAVSGRGGMFKSGGRVVKNVTGYDLCKLMAGSFGTLAALTEVTVKVLPAPEKILTVLLFGQNDSQAIPAMSRAAGSPHEVSALAHLPDVIASRSTVSYIAMPGHRSRLYVLKDPVHPLNTARIGCGSYGVTMARLRNCMATTATFFGRRSPTWHPCCLTRMRSSGKFR